MAEAGVKIPITELKLPAPEVITELAPFQFDVYNDFKLIRNKKHIISYTLINADAQLGAFNDFGVFFIAPIPCTVLSVREVHEDPSTTASTVDVVKLTGTQALAAGTSVLLTPFDLTVAADTVQTGVASPTIQNRQLDQNNRLGIRPSGTRTGIKKITVTIEIQYQI